MDEFTFFPGIPGAQCKIPAAPLPFPRRDHHLGLVGSPPPWLLAAATAVTEDDDGGDGAEKMDLLWEDFNEELARTPPVCPLSPLNMKAKESWLIEAVDDDVDVAGGGSGEQRRRMYSGSVVRRRRRWSLLLMLRLLKSVFLAKNKRNPRTAPI
uniref:Uncharacterized protein n=1 Tax=Leersia perrieri TaxID=77586 RepID=A0A0D9XQ21_9ORYZ